MGKGVRGTIRAHGFHLTKPPHPNAPNQTTYTQTQITEFIPSQSQGQTTSNGGGSGSGLSLSQRMEQFAQQGIYIPVRVHTAANAVDERNKRRDLREDDKREFRPGRGKNTRVTRMVSYNSNSMNTYDRACLISTVFRGSTVGVQGTRVKHGRYDSSHSKRQTDYHTIYDFSCPEGRSTNEPAGVAILIPKNMEPFVRSIHKPKDTVMQGRAGAIRIKQDKADLDVTFITVYAHTELPGREEDKRNVAIWHWVDELIADLPSRTVPIIFTDANGRVGSNRTQTTGGRDTRAANLEYGPNGYIDEHSAETRHPVGPYGTEQENKNGKLLRTTAERHGMVLINTWDPDGCGPSYFHNANENGVHTVRHSRIDYILLPSSVMGLVKSVRSMVGMGVILQTGNPTGFPKDHVPISMEIHWPPVATNSRQTTKVDMDALARAVADPSSVVARACAEWMENEFQNDIQLGFDTSRQLRRMVSYR